MISQGLSCERVFYFNTINTILYFKPTDKEKRRKICFIGINIFLPPL